MYFNEPLSILQKAGCPLEFVDILDNACAENNPIKRMAIIAFYHCVQITSIEKFPQKPFNPLLGETYEFYVPGKYQFLAE